MALEDIAKALVKSCRKGKFMDVIEKYYADDIVSVEPVGNPQMPKEMSGIEAIRGKNKWFEENNEINSCEVDGPYLGKGQFAVRFNIEITPKGSGKRVSMTEMALYTVKKNKIVREEFYYAPQGPPPPQ